ncbi:Ig-like domain-containing protein [Parabacteroides gordonii]|uniref:Ig-like domain-containing protein n=1 Tax=Parabacteroides gordonii TaxID=574930 RepID=UPI0026EABA99|nr:Ig-like domain-containing protein [Parabacteroides gordonii]
MKKENLSKSSKIVSFFILLGFCLSFQLRANDISHWDGKSYSTGWYKPGKSTYYIQTAADLCGLSHLLRPGNYVDFSGKEIVLMTDIDLGNHEWETIGCITNGNYYYTFSGTFNGNGNTISGLKISQFNDASIKTVGLFGVLMDSKATIKNLTVEGNITLTSDISTGVHVGGITGLNYATIYNCILKVDISMNVYNATSDVMVGCITGNNANLIRNCQTQGSIRISQDAISGCRVGGIIGLSSTSELGAGVIRCKSATNITIIGGKNAMVGGIAALITETNSDNLYTGCIDVNDCYHTFAGGIVSSMSSAKNCLMLGSFTGYGNYYYKGAIRATNDVSRDIENCFYREGLPNSSNEGVAVDNYTLQSGETLPGFSSAIWDFSNGKNPDLLFRFEEPIKMPEIQSISLNKEKMTMKVGDETLLIVTLYPTGITDQITWTSDNPDIASVGLQGKVTAHKEGSAVIMARTSNNKTAFCTVEVMSSSTANEDILTNITELTGGKGQISIKTSVIADAYIYTINGRLVKKCSLGIGTNEFSLEKNIYIIKVGENSQKVFVY